MRGVPIRLPDVIAAGSIAPCGMDCALCLGFLRDKNTCSGCNTDDVDKPRYCASCRIKNCPRLEELEPEFCSFCPSYPCARLRQLDKRYRTRYGMSMIENLNSIREQGLDAFVEQERVRWRCPGCGGVICVHRKACLYCGKERDGLSGLVATS